MTTTLTAWQQEEAERRALRREISQLAQNLAVLNEHVDRLESGEVIIDLRRALASLEARLEHTNQQLLRYAQDLATAVRQARLEQARAEAAQQARAAAERRLAVATRLIIDTLLLAMEQRAPGSELHARRVAAWATAVAPALGVDDVARSTVRIAGLLHDAGILGLPVLPVPDPATGGWQPGVAGQAGAVRWRETLPLTRTQQAVIRPHPALGAGLLEQTPPVAPAARLVLAHHERWDGRGYPSGRRRGTLDPAEQALMLGEAFDGVMMSAGSGAGLSVAWLQHALSAAVGGPIDTSLAETLLAAWEQTMALAAFTAPDQQ